MFGGRCKLEILKLKKKKSTGLSTYQSMPIPQWSASFAVRQDSPSIIRIFFIAFLSPPRTRITQSQEGTCLQKQRYTHGYTTYQPAPCTVFPISFLLRVTRSIIRGIQNRSDLHFTIQQRLLQSSQSTL